MLHLRDVRLVGLAVVLLASACRPARPHRAIAQDLLAAPSEIGIERGEGRQSVPPGTLLEVDGDLRLDLELPLTPAWEVLPPDARIGGGNLGGLAAWRLPLALPAAASGGVELWRDGQSLARWRASTDPEAWSFRYSPGGFLQTGFLIAVPPGVDPNAWRYRCRFRPTATALATHLAAAGRPVPGELLVTRAQIGPTSRQALFVPAGEIVVLPLRQASGSPRLEFGVARRVPPWETSSGPARLEAGLRSGGDVDWLWRLDLSGDAPTAAWTDVRLDLPAFEEGELLFRLTGIGPGAPPEVFLSHPVVTASRSAPDPRPNLVLVILDGLRADRLDGEPPHDGLMPNLHRLASRGQRFLQARAVAPWTRPSVASLFTGVPPSRHGVETESGLAVLGEDLPTLAARLHEKGYATAGASANLHLVPAFGLQRGFEEFWCAYDDGSVVLDRGLEWLDRVADRPFFLFLFLMDTHYTYRHRPQFDRSSHLPGALYDISLHGGSGARSRQGAAPPTAGELAKLEALYDENVAYSDDVLGRLLKSLATRRLERRTVVVVTADHGEAFGEHGDYFHGWNLYEELLRVPLVIAGPGVPRGAERSDSVSHLALPGTLLALAGVPSEGFDNWAPPLSAPAPARPAAVFAETSFRGVELAAAIRWPYKLIWNLRRRRRVELYDLARDPGEQANLARQELGRTAVLRKRLAAWLGRARQERDAVAPGDRAVLDPQTLEALKALGYVQ